MIAPVLGEEDMKKKLEVGDSAPLFELVGSDGEVHRLADHIGKRPVVIAWFPKAFTSGCTIECKALRESGDEIRKFDVAYYAASIDSADKNRKFAESLELDYPILSDSKKDAAKAFGVLRALGTFTARHTFYIGADGKILYIDRDVDPKNAGKDLVARLEALGIQRQD
jgi:peroxiredoxin Q/BCP